VPRGAWAAPPQARTTATRVAWSASSWVHVAPHSAWAAYTFSVITSIGIKNVIISFLIILFLV